MIHIIKNYDSVDYNLINFGYSYYISAFVVFMKHFLLILGKKHKLTSDSWFRNRGENLSVSEISNTSLGLKAGGKNSMQYFYIS